MKLLRLVSTSQNAIFENNFATDIVLPENSKIALKSLSLENVLNEITIGPLNDTLKFHLKSSQGFLSCELDHRTYDTLAVPALLNQMTARMNAQLTIHEKIQDPTKSFNNIGQEIRVEDANQIHIKFRKSILGENFNLVSLQKGVVDVSHENLGGRSIYSPASAVATSTDSFMFYPLSLARGAGLFRFRIHDLDLSGNNFFLGLTHTNPQHFENDEKFSLSKFVNYIQLDSSASTIKSNDGTTSTDTGVTVNFNATGSATNDHICVGVNKGKIIYLKYANGVNQPVTLASFDYNMEDKDKRNLFPVLVFQSADFKVNLVRSALSPYDVHPNLVNDYVVEDETSLGAGVPLQNQGNQNYSFSFVGNSLATFLGFKELSHPMPFGDFIKAKQFDVLAPLQFKGNNKSDAFIVEMLNLPLESYDGLTQDKRSYLNIIPVSDGNGEIIYDSNYPLFVNLGNTKPILLRNIKCRVLNADLSPVVMRGLATLVILVQ